MIERIDQLWVIETARRGRPLKTWIKCAEDIIKCRITKQMVFDGGGMIMQSSKSQHHMDGKIIDDGDGDGDDDNCAQG